MSTPSDAAEFLRLRRIAVAGVSSSPRKFGSIVFRHLRDRGYEVIPLHPRLDRFDGIRCHPSLTAAPSGIEGVVTVVPPAETEKVVREAVGAGVKSVWMQQGSESDAAIAFCCSQGMNVVHGRCILMFSEPTGFIHRLHRWFWERFGGGSRASR
ncbi:MAG: CoA-binding protein [Bacteroidota bacterium]